MSNYIWSDSFSDMDAYDDPLYDEFDDVYFEQSYDDEPFEYSMTFEPTTGDPVFIRSRPKRDKPVRLDDCGDTYTDINGIERSYCYMCWQPECGKRDTRREGAPCGSVYDILS